MLAKLTPMRFRGNGFFRRLSFVALRRVKHRDIAAEHRETHGAALQAEKTENPPGPFHRKTTSTHGTSQFSQRHDCRCASSESFRLRPIMASYPDRADPRQPGKPHSGRRSREPGDRMAPSVAQFDAAACFSRAQQAAGLQRRQTLMDGHRGQPVRRHS